jgi:hypothetical protein
MQSKTSGTALALQNLNGDTNAALAAYHRNLSGEYAMPSRQNDQGQPADAIAMLKADHQRVRDLVSQYEATNNQATKRTLAEQVFMELETHAQLEENIFGSFQIPVDSFSAPLVVIGWQAQP